MDAIDGKKTYVLAALYAFGYGAVQAGILGVFTGAGQFDVNVFLPYLFEGGFIATFRHALAKLG